MGIMVILFTFLGVVITGEDYLKTQGHQKQSKGVIAIDPGHGGKDPGKVGCHGELEKEINLEISLILRQMLEKEGFQVVLTREADNTATGEYDSTKSQDMTERIRKIEESKPYCCVSIHQNSYTTSGVKGAQVFYHPDSEEGYLLAGIIQEHLIKTADPENTRKIKSSDSYYILEKTNCPVVLVECGFLSDEDESVRLTDAEYQKLLAQAVFEGIMEYVESKKELE